MSVMSLCFLHRLITNVSCGFTLDPKKVPAADSSDLLHYGEDSVDLLLAHYGAEQPADTVDGDEYNQESSHGGKPFEATYRSSQRELCTPS